MNTDTDVLVVGAGPTGLMLANQLGRRGVRARIIDRHTGPSLQTRALGVQARTLEIYTHLGIVERALELGKRATGANIWVQGRRAARLPLGDIGRDLSPYPFLLILGQDDNERLLGDVLCKQGMAVDWSTELVGLAQDTSHVKATLQQPDGTIEEMTFDEVIPAVRQQAGTALSFETCSWFSTYRIHHRRAARFRDRRCFLLGDAAHIHSPVGAQGMNTGLQDAYNLAWKLALVVSGRAAPALLDSYADERIPVARRLLGSTDRGFSLIVSDNKLAQL